MIWTVLLNQLQILKEESLVPSALKRAILLLTTHLYVEKIPPTKNFPSFCVSMVWTVLLNPTGNHVSKLGSILAVLANT